MPVIPLETLRPLTLEVIEALGTPKDIAELVTESLLAANLVGHDSHGILRIEWYAQTIQAQRLIPDARAEVKSRHGATAVIDGHFGWGPETAWLGTKTASAIAKELGVGAVTLIQSNHIGRIGEYVEWLARQELIGLAFCNASPAVAPFGGRQRIMGTNPFAWAAPGEPGQPPWVLDFATSGVAEGKLRVARAAGSQIGAGLVLDAEGNPSFEPAAFYNGGVMLPFGQHKGSGMSVMIELLARGLADADHGLPGHHGFNGTVIIALDPLVFAPETQYDQAVERLHQQLSNCPPAEAGGRVMLPGEPERITREKRLASGIPIAAATWTEFLKLAESLGVTTA